MHNSRNMSLRGTADEAVTKLHRYPEVGKSHGLYCKLGDCRVALGGSSQ